MPFLLDTHVIIWWQTQPEKLPRPVADVLRDATVGRLFYSPISAYELAYKLKLGKLPFPQHIIDNFAAAMSAQSFDELAVTANHALAAAQLDLRNRDPFDRFLVAQALIENMTIISNEALFEEAGVDRLWQ